MAPKVVVEPMVERHEVSYVWMSEDMFGTAKREKGWSDERIATVWKDLLKQNCMRGKDEHGNLLMAVPEVYDKRNATEAETHRYKKEGIPPTVGAPGRIDGTGTPIVQVSSSAVPGSSSASLAGPEAASGVYLVPAESVIGLDTTHRPSTTVKDMLPGLCGKFS